MNEPAKRRINVGHIVHSLSIGGMERIVVTLMGGVDRRRFASSVYCLQRGGEHIGPLRRDGFKTLEFDKKPGINYSLPVRLARVLKKDNIDIVHCHNFGGLFYGLIGARMGNVPCVVYTAHGPGFPHKWRQSWFQRLAFTDRVIAVSDHVRRDAVEKAGLKEDVVTTIPNGVDLTLYRRPSDDAIQKKKAELGLEGFGPVIGTVARLSPEKDHATLIEAFSRLASIHTKARLVLVGDGEMMGELKERATRLGIGLRVDFLGSRSDVTELLPVFDVFALASKEEGLGITIIEAMAEGVPVVGTNVGGIPEIITDGETGVLVPPGTPDKLAEAIDKLLSNPVEAARLAAAARNTVEIRYDMCRMIEGYENVYEDVLKEKQVDASKTRNS